MCQLQIFLFLYHYYHIRPVNPCWKATYKATERCVFVLEIADTKYCLFYKKVSLHTRKSKISVYFYSSKDDNQQLVLFFLGSSFKDACKLSSPEIKTHDCSSIVLIQFRPSFALRCMHLKCILTNWYTCYHDKEGRPSKLVLYSDRIESGW